MVAGLCLSRRSAGPMAASLETEILDVGGACFAHPQAAETEQHRKGGVLVAVPLGREQEDIQLEAIQAACLCGMRLRLADVSPSSPAKAELPLRNDGVGPRGGQSGSQPRHGR